MAPQRSHDDKITAEDARNVVDEARPVMGVDPDDVERVVRPNDDWILVRLDGTIEQTLGGILVPDKSKPEPRMGVVVSQGPGMLLEDGRSRADMYCKPGDRILFERRAGVTIPRVEKHMLIRPGSLLAVVKHGRETADILPASVEDDVEPVQDWALIRVDKPPETAGKRRALILPESARRGFVERHVGTGTGVVVKIGPGLQLLDGRGRAAVSIRRGQRVLYGEGSYEFQEIQGIDGYALVRAMVCVAALDDSAAVELRTAVGAELFEVA